MKEVREFLSSRRKFDINLLSLWPFVAIFVIVTTNFGSIFAWQGVISTNLLPFVLIAILAYCWYTWKKLCFELSGSTEIPFEIKKLEPIPYSVKFFFSSYVVAVVIFYFTPFTSLILLPLLAASLYMSTLGNESFLMHPTFRVLGFHLYKIDGNFKNGERHNITVLSRKTLYNCHKVSYIPLDTKHDIYYAVPVKS